MIIFASVFLRLNQRPTWDKHPERARKMVKNKHIFFSPLNDGFTEYHLNDEFTGYLLNYEFTGNYTKLERLHEVSPPPAKKKRKEKEKYSFSVFL